MTHASAFVALIDLLLLAALLVVTDLSFRRGKRDARGETRALDTSTSVRSDDPRVRVRRADRPAPARGAPRGHGPVVPTRQARRARGNTRARHVDERQIG